LDNTPLEIEIFSDFVCPWCYLASAVVEKLVLTIPLTIKWSAFPLHPGTPQEGLLLSELLRGVNLDSIHQRLYTLMDELGLEHGQRNYTFNSTLAQELALWAATQTDSTALHKLIFRAYFVHNRNLALPEVLLDLVAAAKLDVTAASAVLQKRSFCKAVEASWERARQFQITGVPTFIAGAYQCSGFQPLQELQRFIEYVQQQQALA
jgi:predicted DsbA family dithiol-disulfide isomerase